MEEPPFGLSAGDDFGFGDEFSEPSASDVFSEGVVGEGLGDGLAEALGESDGLGFGFGEGDGFGVGFGVG